MGIVRRHPFLTFVFLLGALPVLAAIAWEAAQYSPACRAWRAQVAAKANADRDLPAFDDYHRGEMSVDEYLGNVRDQVAWDMRETRPLLCD